MQGKWAVVLGLPDELTLYKINFTKNGNQQAECNQTVLRLTKNEGCHCHGSWSCLSTLLSNPRLFFTKILSSHIINGMFFFFLEFNSIKWE
jgi:hypothetical protein